MKNEQVTGLYFNESNHRMWIMYTQLYPARYSGLIDLDTMIVDNRTINRGEDEYEKTVPNVYQRV